MQSTIQDLLMQFHFTYCRNESDVGRGVHNSSVSSDNVFIVTKLWVEHHGTERVKREFMASLKR